MAANRSRDARKLEQLLREHTDANVQIVYHGPPSKDRRGRRWGGWSVDWWDGPLPDEMKHLVAEQIITHAPAMGEVELRYSRSYTDRGEALAVLLWLDADPERATRYHRATLPSMAFEEIAYPERADEGWQLRAAALETLSGSRVIGSQVYQSLIDRIQQDGWPAVLVWLDNVGTDGRRLRIVPDPD